ncbi:uncharacterized protein LOC125666908 isoform X1 [Ostrea edulis]|nr:uncharacterized protein LOC125666908 isoform X1 [Ostrea edulis]XP_048756198.2 uncharacterized protein LOC125666908 isoform X1 [Ostrea edulis]
MKDHAELKLYDEFDAVNKTLCPKGEDKKYHRRDCIDRKCALCGTAILKTQLKDVIEINNQEEIKWSKWEVVKTFNRKTNKEVSKRQEVLKSGTPEELIDEIANELDFLSIHLFEARWQQDQFSQLSKEFPEKSVVMTIDFAENYTCFSQNEIQGAHWAKDSVTIHPCVVLYRCPNDGEIVDECVDIVSDDLCHDSHAVNFFTKSVMKHLKEERQLEIDHAYIISDGCAGQYKSKVPLMDASCSKEDLGCTVERCYYGSRHGKNRCDGEAGVLKAKGTRAVKNGEAIIYDAKSFYNCVKSLEKGPAGETECKHKRRTILWVDSTAINRKRDDRNVKTVEGTRKLHSVLGEQRGTIRTRRLSCFCEQCLCFRFDRCTNTGHVEMWKTVFLKSIQQQVVEDQDDLDHDAEGIVLDAVVADDEDGMLIRQNADENDIVADHNVENHEQAPVEGVDLLEAGGSDDLFNVGELQDLSYDANTSFSYIKDVDDIGSQEMPLTTNRTKNLFILIFSRTFQRIIGQ